MGTKRFTPCGNWKLLTVIDIVTADLRDISGCRDDKDHYQDLL